MRTVTPGHLIPGAYTVVRSMVDYHVPVDRAKVRYSIDRTGGYRYALLVDTFVAHAIQKAPERVLALV